MTPRSGRPRISAGQPEHDRIALLEREDLLVKCVADLARKGAVGRGWGWSPRAGQVGRAVGRGGDELMPHDLADVGLAHAEADRLRPPCRWMSRTTSSGVVPLSPGDRDQVEPGPIGPRRYRAIRTEAPPSRASSVLLDLAPQSRPASRGRRPAGRNRRSFPGSAQCGTTIAASLVLEAMYGYWSAVTSWPARRRGDPLQGRADHPQFALPLAFRCEMWTGSAGPLPTAMASSIASSRLGPFAADMRGIQAPVPVDDPRQLDQLGRRRHTGWARRSSRSRCPRHRPPCRARPDASSVSSSAAARRPLRIAHDRRSDSPWGTRWITLVPAP